MRARIVIIATVVAVASLAADQAGAARRPTPDVAGAARFERVALGAGATRRRTCEWRVLITDDLESAVYDGDTLARVHSPTGRWLERWCDGRQLLVNGVYAVPEAATSRPSG